MRRSCPFGAARFSPSLPMWAVAERRRRGRGPFRDGDPHAPPRCAAQILNISAELAQRLQVNGDIDPVALTEAAELFRDMGVNYHERIEEAFIFPDVRKWSGLAEKLVEVLLDQHQRGREITDCLCRVGARGLIDAEAGQLAKAIASMARMYNAHTAWEETVIYPLWKTLPEERLEEVSRKVRAMEHEKFGDFGFNDAVLGILEDRECLGSR